MGSESVRSFESRDLRDKPASLCYVMINDAAK